MIKITLTVDSDDVITVKETLKDYLERFGDVRAVEVVPVVGEQLRMEGTKEWIRIDKGSSTGRGGCGRF